MRPPLHRLPVPLLTPRRARGAQRSCRRPWEAPAGGVLGTGRTPGFWASPRLLWTCCPPASHPWVPLGPGNPGGALQVLAGGGPAAPAEKALAPSPRALPTASRPRPRPRGRTSRPRPHYSPAAPRGPAGQPQSVHQSPEGPGAQDRTLGQGAGPPPPAWLRAPPGTLTPPPASVHAPCPLGVATLPPGAPVPGEGTAAGEQGARRQDRAWHGHHAPTVSPGDVCAGPRSRPLGAGPFVEVSSSPGGVTETGLRLGPGGLRRRGQKRVTMVAEGEGGGHGPVAPGTPASGTPDWAPLALHGERTLSCFCGHW